MQIQEIEEVGGGFGCRLILGCEVLVNCRRPWQQVCGTCKGVLDAAVVVLLHHQVSAALIPRSLHLSPEMGLA